MSNPVADSFNSPEAVMQIMTRLEEIIDQREEMASRRMLPRRQLVLPISVQFLDAQNQPCSKTLDGISLDISYSGIGFVCDSHVPDSRYALIQFTQTLGQHIPVIVDIKNLSMLGPYCRIGGVFNVDWADSDQ